MTSMRAIRTMLGLAFRADPLRFAASLTLTVIEALSFGFSAYGLKLLTDAAVHRDAHAAVIAGVVTAVLATSAAGANWVGYMLRIRLREETELALDLRLLDATMGSPRLEHFERPDYADELLLLRTQRSELSQLNDTLTQNFQLAIQGTTVLGLLARVHPLLLLLPLFGLPSVLATRRGEQARQQFLQQTAEPQRLRNHLFSLLTSAGPAKEIRVFGVSDELRSRFHTIGHDLESAMTAVEARGSLLAALGWLIFGIGFLGAITFVTALALRPGSTTTPGDLVLTLSLARQINNQVTWTVATTSWMIRLLKTANRYIWLTDHCRSAMAEAAPTRAASMPERLERGITLDGISFRYPGTEVEVLRDVTAELPAGAIVAIVGDNGVGKSTLVKLLARFYEPTSGQLLVDDIPIRDIPIDAWRDRLSAGFQDFAKFELLARESVGVGSLPHIDVEPAVLTALERAHAIDVIESLPEGLNTQLGRSFTDGRELSGGQWQKLALGRAMMRSGPLVLLLDEPTSALDALTEHALFEQYADAGRRLGAVNGAVTVLVSHRFSTVRMADLILVLDQGRLAESGDHDSLIRLGGLYAELFELQARSCR